jgi:hypothetical protein
VGGFAQLGAVPETTYLIAFQPDSEDTAGKYHKLKLQLTGEHAGYAQMRPGYFAPGASADGEKPLRQIDREALASDTITDIPVRLFHS